MAVVRQNYHPDSEKALNAQILVELEGMYTYLSMATYFQKSEQALPGLAEYFRKAAEEEMRDVHELCKYQNKRGGSVDFKDIKRPAKSDWGTSLDAMVSALDMEKEGNALLHRLHQIAGQHEDHDLTNFLEGHFLQEAVDTIKELGEHITNLKRVKEGHGVYHFDKIIK